MGPDRSPTGGALAGWPGMLALAAAVTTAPIAFFAVRDGVAWGDVLGGLVIGALTLAVLAALRWYTTR